MKQFLLILCCLNFSALAEECFTREQVNEELINGMTSELLKPKYLLSEKIEHLSFINLIRGSLDANNDEQSISIDLIDQTTNIEFIRFTTAINSGALTSEDFLLKKEDLLFLIKEVEKERVRHPSAKNSNSLAELKHYLNLTS
jgi:hypothetical protein